MLSSSWECVGISRDSKEASQHIPPEYTRISGCIRRGYRRGGGVGRVPLLQANGTTPRLHVLEGHNCHGYTQKSMSTLDTGHRTALCEGREHDLVPGPGSMTDLFNTESDSTSLAFNKLLLSARLRAHNTERGVPSTGPSRSPCALLRSALQP